MAAGAVVGALVVVVGQVAHKPRLALRPLPIGPPSRRRIEAHPIRTGCIRHRRARSIPQLGPGLSAGSALWDMPTFVAAPVTSSAMSYAHVRMITLHG